MPESIDMLRENIQKRGGMSPSELEERLSRAQEEMDNVNVTDHIVVNIAGKLDKTVETIVELLAIDKNSQT